MRAGRWLAPALLLAALPCAAQVTGRAFEDRDADGILDAGEPVLSGVPVQLFGTRDAGGAFDQTVTTGADGRFTLSPGSGCYLLRPSDPAGWRMAPARDDGVPEGTPGYTFPVGRPRPAKLDQGIPHLQAGALRFAAMGDSIAWNWNSCFYSSSFWYSKQVRDRLACAAPGASVVLDQAAVKGEHTDDLLVDDAADLNNVFRVLEAQPDLVTLSMIGNDLLGVDPPANPSQAQVNRAVAEVLDARQNLQEALSVLVSEVPGADLALNSLYDNEAWNCYAGDSGAFHRTWLPIVDRVLRELAWGQARRISVIEAAADFAHEDQAGGCAGYDAMICRDVFQTDLIHPNNNGYTLMREKAWEAVGGASLGPKDALARATQTLDYGFLRRVRRLFPTRWETRSGAAVSAPEAAFRDDDGGAAASITLGTGAEEVRFAGFPDWLDEIQVVKALAGVRYRTGGTVTDDLYRMEASVTGQFRAPAGHAYTPTDWNFFTPIVGGGGPGQPPENPDYPDAKLLARPNVASPRTVTATLTKNPVLPPGAAEYQWPPLTHPELATTVVRVAAAPVAGTPGDAYTVELDAAWLDLYGWEKPRPGEAADLRVDRLADGTLEVSFEPPAGAARHNLYLGGLGPLRATGRHDHGTDARCAAPTADAGGGRLKIVLPPGSQPGADTYLLVTGHVDDVESPSGTAHPGGEIDRSQSVCQ